ncbi:lytic transglycosylase domain-containing protein [Sphaerisporangium sp. NBC_01403]|uniref:aggregation-promoting factor C-terminal-like domain-containing protein n=1 Tax=Sphaerisporangium sp. NBC_01403 TaxID=2903599 RepID=UPI003245BB82
MDSNRAFRGAVAAVIAAAALNGTAGPAQALAGSTGTADAITGTAEPPNAETGPVETALETAPAEVATATSSGTAGPVMGPATAGAPAGATAAKAPFAPAPLAPEILAPLDAANATTASVAAPRGATALPGRPASTAWSRARPAWIRTTPAARPIWTRAGLAGMAELIGAPKATVTAARVARAARRMPIRVHRGVWRTSAHPNVRVWAPKTPKGRNKAIAYRLVTQRSWPVTQFRCLDSLWTRESNWNHRAQNPSSGAYGIPQALPGYKMVGIGHDWRVNPATQIRWGLKYIKGRYGSPCGAWGHFQSHNWY